MRELPTRKGSIYTSDALPTSNRMLTDTTSRGQSGIAALVDPFDWPQDPELSETSKDAPPDTLRGRFGLKDSPMERDFWLSLAVHFLVALLCLSVAMDIYDGSLFSFHPISMTLGFVGLMSEGVLVASRFSRFEGGGRTRAIQTHALIQAAALVCIMLGFWTIWRNKVGTTPLFVLRAHPKTSDRAISMTWLKMLSHA